MAASTEVSRDTAQTPRPLILVVDDEDAVREVVADILAMVGYRVLQVSNGADALRLVAQAPDVALLVSDVTMPGMDGFELADAVTRLRPSLGVVFITGYAARQPRSGMKLLPKPFRIEQLLSFVADALRR